MIEFLRRLNKDLTQYLGIDLIGFFILLPVVALIFITNFPANAYQKISATIIWITAVTIIQYTKETFKLRRINEQVLEGNREAIKENERSRKNDFLPIIKISGYAEDYYTFVVHLVNIGRGLAQNVFVLFPSQPQVHLGNLSEKDEREVRSAVFTIQEPEKILLLPKIQRRIRVECLDIFGRKITSWALLETEATEVGNPRRNHLKIASWSLELPE